MTIYPLRTATADLSRLTTPTERYIFADHTPEETEQIAKDLIEAMYKYGGLGLAANQLIWPYEKYSFFAMRGPDTDYICFNPIIVMPSEETVKLEEGCLSFPGMVFKLTRPRHIRMRFADAHTQVDTFLFANLTARIIQHEMDHLAGKLFFEGIPRPTLERVLRQAKNRGFDYSGLGLYKYIKRNYNDT